MSDSKNQLSVPDIADCIYTQCYCEENIWKLCEHVQQSGQTEALSRCFAVFVSNDLQQTPLFCSKLGNQSDGLIIWDYHVFLVYASEEEQPLVYDFDSNVKFPCPLLEYVLSVLRTETNIKTEYHRMFRVISGEEYLTKFSSDRSKMRKPDGTWIKDPPVYPCILNTDGTTNLDDFISMDTKRCDVGIVVDFKSFQRLFLKKVYC